MNPTQTPEEVALSIKAIIKEKYGSLNAYANEKKITPTQLYTLLNGKEYISLFSAVRFCNDLDLNIEYCTKGLLPVFNPEHNYNTLLKVAKDFFYAVKEEDDFRGEYENKYERLSSEERHQFDTLLKKLRINKAKAGCTLVDLLNLQWNVEKENYEQYIEKPSIPKNKTTLHEAIQEVLRRSGHPLTFTEIANRINELGLYNRKDNQLVPASQISARIRHCPQLFTIITETTPMTIKLTNH